MKLRNLLVLGALLLAGSASAAIQERQKPVFTPNPIEAFTDGTTSMYLYNVGAGKFFCGSNNWGTRTSIDDEGYRVYFEQYVVDAEAGWDGTTVIFKDSCLAKEGKIMEVFFDNVNGGCFVDRGSQANRYWKLQKNADNAYYRLSMAECNPDYQAWQVDAHPNTFWGWADNLPGDEGNNGKMDTTTVYSFLDPVIPNNHVDWAVISVADYDAHFALVEVYNVAQELASLIAKAAALGSDVAALETVYNNAAATVEELEAAIVSAKEVLAKAEETNVDPKNPIDKTSFIVNPTMEDTSGWTPIEGVQNRATHTNVTSGAYTAETLPAYEHWNNGAYTGKFYQVLTGLPNGLYKLTAAVMGDQQPAAEGTGLYLYANDYKTPVVSNIPAYYDVFAEVTDGTLEIGWTAELKHSQWISSDSYSLLYYGNKGEATYTGAVQNLIEANLSNFDGREAEVSVGAIDAYKATLNGLVAADMDGLNAAILTVKEANADMQANIDGWVKYAAEINRGNDTRMSTSYNQNTAEMKAMAAYVARTAPAILKNKALSTEDLLAEIENLTQLIEDAIFNSMLDDSDVTDVYLKNARYDDGTTGWLGNWTAVNYGCMEAYELEWDAYQIVEKAPQGVYEISLQGFYRVARGEEAYNMYLNGQQACPGHVYINGHLNEVKCVFDEPVKAGDGYIYEAIGTGPESNPNAFVGADGDSIFFPNDMKTAGEAFAAGMYVSAANGIVAQKGDQLRVGVKGKKQGATWVIWDNFKLVFRGKNIQYTKPYLQEAIAAAEVTLTQPMTKDAKELLTAAKANAESVLSSEDRDVVFDALVQIYAANDSVEASAELFTKLSEAIDKLDAALMEYQDAGAAAINKAQDLMLEIMSGLDESSLTKERAAELLEMVDPAIMALAIGEGPYTDENPKDLTILLSCPSFEDVNGAGSAEGWTGANGATGSYAYEFYQKTFDLYQEISGLPNGTYHLTVSAFERCGSSVNDYDTYQVNPDSATTFIYGTSGDVTYQAPVCRLASAAMLGNPLGIEGLAAVDTLKDVEEYADSIYYVPNTMASGATFFNDYEEYGCDVWIEVTDGTLRIGMKKDVQASNDWVLMDNFQLFYHGTESAFRPESIGEVVLGTNANVVKSEIFSVSGARVNKLQKGLNLVRRTHADGRVTMQKLFVK